MTRNPLGKLPNPRRRGFLLLESMIAVFMFAVGLLALGECVRNLMRAERFKREDSRASMLLANYFALIENGADPTDDVAKEVGGDFEGLKVHTEKEPLKLKNEKDQDVFGLYQVTITVSWKSDKDEMNRGLTFLVYPRNNMKGFNEKVK